MTVKILKQDKNTLELDLGEIDQSLAVMMVEKLNETKGVVFAAYKREHPVVGAPHLIVKTKGSDPAQVLAKVLDGIKKDVGDFKKKFSDIVK
jgi:DNA-directed RNA polymerase subunit L